MENIQEKDKFMTSTVEQSASMARLSNPQVKGRSGAKIGMGIKEAERGALRGSYDEPRVL